MIEAPHVGLVIDTSGSMSAYEYALGPIALILTDGLRQIGGRCASALFGNGAELLADGAAPLALVPGIATGGGAGWSDREHQQPVGDTGRHEPRLSDAIADAELQRALDDPDPLRAIAGLAARWSAAFVLDPTRHRAPRATVSAVGVVYEGLRRMPRVSSWSAGSSISRAGAVAGENRPRRMWVKGT